MKLMMKLKIYPSKKELHRAIEAYLKKNHKEFFSSFIETDWTSYYNDNFHKNISSFLLNLYIDKILTFSQVVKTSSIITGCVSHKNKRSNVFYIRKSKLTVN